MTKKSTFLLMALPLVFLIGCEGGGSAGTFTCTGQPGNIVDSRWDDLAKKSGFCGMNKGVSGFIASARNREVSLEGAVGYLFRTGEGDDGFRSIQVLDDVVLYSYDLTSTQECKDFDRCNYDHPADGATIIVGKDPGQVYLEGQMLNMVDMFVFMGMTSYETAMGGTAQAFVFQTVTNESLNRSK